jgi:hypothetical protein
MTAFATLNGVQIATGKLYVPRVGMWVADIALNSDSLETGPCSIVLGNLTLAGAVFRSDPFAGQTRVCAVGGAAGWRNQVAAKPYGNPNGVSLGTVLGDAAGEVGETMGSVSGIVGPFYARPADIASFSLRAFCPAWYVDTKGVTQVASWPTTTVSTPFTVIEQNTAEGIVEIATEDYASWLPGAMFTAPTLAGTFQCAGLVYTFAHDGKARLQVLTDATSDRLLGPLHSIIDQRMSTSRFYGRYRYTISNPTITTVDAVPVDPTIGLPSLNGVPLDSDSISTYIPPSGQECHIMFADGKPTMPRVVWTAGTATVVNVLGGGVPVARQGDQVTCFLPPTLVVNGIIDQPSPGTTLVGTILVPNPISGSINGPCSATVFVQ